MGKLFVDEKGPQENFKISSPFNTKEKLAYGTDIMHGYVANAWYIDKDMDKFTEEFIELEKSYLQTLQNPDIELKGSRILKGRFKYGVTSLRRKDVEFYTKLFELLIKYKSMNLLFSVNKMSIIFDSRLLEWIYLLEEKRMISNAYLTKYSLTKYLNIEASEEVIKSILDLNCTSKDLLNKIQRDMQSLVDANKKNKRMQGQLVEYKKLISTIKKTKHFIVNPPEKIAFDWNKVAYAMDLWLTDNELNNRVNPKDIDLYLDNGIKSSYFEKFSFNSIHENVNSKNNAGVRVTDFLVAIAGNYIKNLHTASQYDREEPAKPKRLSANFFDVTKDQFYLLKLMNEFFFCSGNFSIVVDTFFDDELIFEAFLNYFDQFKSFEEFQMTSNKTHVKEQLKLTIYYFRERWNQGIVHDGDVKNLFSSTREAVASGLLRPL
ncbi:hypothetical protein IGJ66_000477 [Enterococcus sp. DIV0176]|uniref:hypothetical protein n=1 Tax=Enterococcus sp. DIV0176 TaxID=2774758 RepID=UPI003D2FDB5D